MDTKSIEEKKRIEEVGVDNAPNGGTSAWLVIFGCFCVIKSFFFDI